jgi:hypothetical protein
VKLPHRFAGDCRASAGATLSTQTSSGRLLPVSALLTAAVTLTAISVAAARVPSAFSLLSGRVTPLKRATKPSPAGQLSAGAAAAVVIGEPIWERLASPLWPPKSVAVPDVSVQATTSAWAPAVLAF